MTGAPPRNLEEVLTRLGSKLEEWEVRALFLGAQASTNVRLGPQHLLGHLFEGAPVLGDSIDDANANLGVIVGVWNELVDEQRRGVVRLSDLSVIDPPTSSDLADVAERRAAEMTWFVRGIDAGGDDPIELGSEGQDALRRLGEAGAFCEGYKRLLAKKQLPTRREVSEVVVTIGKVTIAALELMGSLLTISAAVRRRAVEEMTASEGGQADAGLPVPRAVNVGSSRRSETK